MMWKHYQIQFDTILYNLNKYSLKNLKCIEAKNDLLKNVEKFCGERNKSFEGFKNNIFPVYYNETLVETSEPDEGSMLENEEIDTTDIPDLENEESAAEARNQLGIGLKTLTPNQMLSRLPTSLAQLNAGNNSEKLKNNRTIIVFIVQIKKTYETTL